MKLISVNLGQSEILPSAAYQKPTGIVKRGVPSATVTLDAVQGDFVADKKHHGGPDQAVYVYFQEDYDWWTAQLSETVEPGSFGENLTISGLSNEELKIGDRLQVGAVRLEVTAPRIPCNTLAARMNDSHFIKRFKTAERPGAYCRVLEPGVVRVGDAVTRVEPTGESVSLLELYRGWYDHKNLTAAQLERFLAAPIAIRTRVVFQELLSSLEPAL